MAVRMTTKRIVQLHLIAVAVGFTIGVLYVLWDKGWLF